MNATLSKKLRFSDVVYAIGATPKAVRLWLQRGLVEIHTPKPVGGGWTEYSFRDIAILALVRSLVNFGVDVPTASSIANTIMGDHFFPQMNSIENPDEIPAGVLASIWTNQRLYLFRDGDAWQMKLVALWDSDMGRRKLIAQIDPDGAEHPNDASFDPALPSGVAAIRRELEPAPVYLSIDVENVLRAAFERASESVNEGAEE
jgi:hypothetical protein